MQGTPRRSSPANSDKERGFWLVSTRMRALVGCAKAVIMDAGVIVISYDTYRSIPGERIAPVAKLGLLARIVG